MRSFSSFAFYLWLAVLSFPEMPGMAADWPIFRGDSQLQGFSSSPLPVKPSLAWSFKTDGPVKSSPVVAHNRVFVGSDDNSVYALNFQDGKKVWAFKTEALVEAPPLFAAETVYVGSVDGFLYALAASDGKLRWKYKTEDKIMGSANLWKNVNGSLNVIVGSFDYRLHCLDALTGKSNWVYESGNYINGTPAVLGDKTVFGGCDGLLHVISLADGKQFKEIEAGAYVAASVTIADDRAYFGNYGNEFLCIDLNKSEGGAPQVPDSTAANGKTGTRTRPSEKGGDENPNVVWRFRDKEFPYFSSAALTKDKVLFGGRDKRLHCLNRADGKEIWTFATQGKVDSSPVIAGGKVVVGSDDGRLYLVSLNDGKELWSYEIGKPIDSSPAVADGKIVIGCDDGSVYCFGEKAK